MKIKVCGLTVSDSNAAIAEMEGIDLLGFIFYKGSKRFTEATLPSVGKERVGVFVDATLPEIENAISQHGLTAVQLHGSETPDFCRQIPKTVTVLKALGIAQKADLDQAAGYENAVDYLLFDTKTPDHGGSGKVFPWSVLEHYTGNLPFFLSGGIGPESVADLEQFHHPKWVGIDLNSRFETSPGIKDPALVHSFINAFTS